MVLTHSERGLLTPVSYRPLSTPSYRPLSNRSTTDCRLIDLGPPTPEIFSGCYRFLQPCVQQKCTIKVYNKKCTGNLHKVYNKFTKSVQEIYKKCTINLQKVYRKFVKSVQEIFKNCTGILQKVYKEKRKVYMNLYQKLYNQKLYIVQ